MITLNYSMQKEKEFCSRCSISDLFFDDCDYSKWFKPLPLFPQIKPGNNSYKLKNKIRQIIYLFCQNSKITKLVYNNLIKSL